jgi:integrase
MAIMGWFSAALATMYQHVLNRIRKDVAKQVGALLWDAKTDRDDQDEDNTEGTATC